MKSIDTLAQKIARLIAQVYLQPEDMVRDVGELDLALFLLRSLFMEAHEREDAFSRERWKQFEETRGVNHMRLMQAKERHRPIDCAADAEAFVADWIELDKRFGIYSAIEAHLHGD